MSDKSYLVQIAEYLDVVLNDLKVTTDLTESIAYLQEADSVFKDLNAEFEARLSGGTTEEE